MKTDMRARQFYEFLQNLGFVELATLNVDVNKLKGVSKEDYERMLAMVQGVVGLESSVMIKDIDMEFIGRCKVGNFVQKVIDQQSKPVSAVEKEHDGSS